MKITHFALACFLASGMLSAAQDNPAIRNIVKGKEYLAENGKRKEVKTTATGLQYEVLKEGTGASPKATSTVEVHYKGTLIDGTEFDSSYKRGQTISFPLNRVIPGWTEGLQLMKEGGKGRLVIPSNLAYGAAGAPPVIGPNETLVFEIELVKVK
jgi:FKBP-type peptidyl-prolyl cis-trans isomerase FklB